MTAIQFEVSDPPPSCIVNRDGVSPFFLVCEHAGNCIPASLKGLGGLPKEELERHIAHDIGALEVATRLSEKLDAILIYQSYSRLLIDCNRRLSNEGLIVEVSDGTRIPGNENLSQASVKDRVGKIWQPFHDDIACQLKERLIKGKRTILITVHSFTPVMSHQARPWHVGLCFNRNPVLSDAFYNYLSDIDPSLVIGLNQPYAVLDEEDHTIPEYGEKLDLTHALIEIRQDQLADSKGRERWAGYLAESCNRYLADLYKHCNT